MEIEKVLETQSRAIKEIVGLLGEMLESQRQWLNEQNRITEQMGKDFTQMRIEELVKRLSEHECTRDINRTHFPASCLCDEWGDELKALKA